MIIAYQISCLRQAVDSVFRLIRVETFFLLYCVCFPARPLLFTSHSPPTLMRSSSAFHVLSLLQPKIVSCVCLGPEPILYLCVEWSTRWFPSPSSDLSHEGSVKASCQSRTL